MIITSLVIEIVFTSPTPTQNSISYQTPTIVYFFLLPDQTRKNSKNSHRGGGNKTSRVMRNRAEKKSFVITVLEVPQRCLIFNLEMRVLFPLLVTTALGLILCSCESLYTGTTEVEQSSKQVCFKEI